MIGSALDSVIGVFSPGWAARRIHARATMEQMTEFLGGGPGGYDAGKRNRLNPRPTDNLNENRIPQGQIERLRWQSWNLYRNNPHARKIVRTLEAKVVGRGLIPQSLATKANGDPDVAFRQRAAQVWLANGNRLDYRGRQHQGGLHLVAMQKQALRTAILSGDTFWRYRRLSWSQMESKGLSIPLQVQLIHTARIARPGFDDEPLPGGGRIYRGIQVDGDGLRTAYWVLNTHPSESIGDETSVPVPADQVGHLYVADDVDQLRGVPWFAPVLMKIRDTGDLEYNELKSSAIAACVVLGFRRPAGAGSFGLQSQAGPVTDLDGNPITSMQPGMLVDLGDQGEMNGFSPNRPTTNVESFAQHMVRTTSAGVTGVKASTLTGDFRESSFASERSADNDIWPELEGVQDWFASGFMQPTYEEVISAAVLAGQFRGIVQPQEFNARRREYLAAEWQGPVARSINPKDDALASQGEIQGGVSSPQIEAAKRGRNWRDVLADHKAFIEYAKELELPDEYVHRVLTGEVPQDGNEENEADGSFGSNDGSGRHRLSQLYGSRSIN